MLAIQSIDEKADPSWIKKQLSYWKEQIRKHPKDKNTRREYSTILGLARELGIEENEMSQAEKLIDSLVGEIKQQVNEGRFTGKYRIEVIQTSPLNMLVLTGDGLNQIMELVKDKPSNVKIHDGELYISYGK